MTEKCNFQTKKFILIFSIDEDDSTSDVIEWLNNYNFNVIRTNPKYIKIIRIEINEKEVSLKFKIKDKIYSTNQLHSFWYRRGGFKKFSYNENSQYDNYLKEENTSLLYFFCHVIDKKHQINSIFNSNINKLKQLDLAKNLGLLVPETFITKSKNELTSFSIKHQQIITKSIHSSLSIKNKKKLKSLYTERFDTNNIQKLENSFFWSCFQKEIIKDYEVRTFYLNGKFYSMAIFSQNNDKTNVDFRNYDYNKPNRNVPYKLPKNIEEKLHLFMISVKLKSGSIDLVVDKSSKYFFLEVNPIGQFGMVSDPCNYYLEEKLALALVANE